MSVPAKWLVWIGRTWEEVCEVLGTWDDKLFKSLEKGSIQIRSNLVKLWVMDGIKRKIYARERQHDETYKVFELLDQKNDTSFYLHQNQERHK